MTATEDHDRIAFDPHDPTFARDGVPFDVLERIRADEPVYRTPAGNWYLSRYHDVEAALKDVDTFRAELGPITGIPGGVLTIPADEHYLSEIPEPRHSAVRRIFNSALATNRVRTVEPLIVEECHRLVDVMLAAEVADLHDGYAAVIPAFAMTQIIGVDAGDVTEFMRWSMDGTLMSRPSTPGVPATGPATHPYFAARVAEQRALPEPTSHLFKVLLTTEVEGATLNDHEVVTQLHFMLQAGVHTTRGFLTHLVNRLVREPDVFAALQADRELVPRFCEESLRHDAPVQRTTRLCTRDTDIAGHPIAAGDWVEMGISSGNRDEAVYERGEEFRLDRPDPRRHLAFGAGSHVCPGATLSRVEGLAAVNVLLDRLEALHTVDGAAYPPVPGSLGHVPIPARLVARPS